MERLNHRTSTLIYGSDTISRRLRICLNPIGYMFKFDPNSPYRPKPLALTVILATSASLFAWWLMESSLSGRTFIRTQVLDLAKGSMFVSWLFKFFGLYRVFVVFAIPLIVMIQHGPIANVIAMNNNFVSKKEQFICARNSFIVFLIKTLVNLTPMTAIYLHNISNMEPIKALPLYFFICCTTIFVNFTIYVPVIYTCYLSASLGKHVENFSKLYIDTLFDQYMKALEEDSSSQTSNHPSTLDFNSDDFSDQSKGCMRYLCCCGCLCTVFRHIKWCFIFVWHRIRELAAHLNSHKYPELPEMKMTKLSTTANLKISDTARASNSHLIRIRLRRTQIMLSELRDVVTDINKMSSPIILMDIIFECLQITTTTTFSVHCKFYKSFSLLIVPTIAGTISLCMSITFICICLDMPISELKLMVNKLFDFIIMNHRIQPQGKSALERAMINGSREDNRLLSLAAEREKEALSETWSQFQYTRKLANTIQFTMGGILPVTRRLLLPVLGHILSAVFISIEIMSIIDTSV